jgi:hypothetical protein
MSPALAILAEKIGWHAGNNFGIKIGIETEKVRMSPDIGAVKVYEDGDIASDAN